MKYYLRMEGVNIGNFVYDTDDLSTVRGGGLLLLDAVKRVEESFKFLEPITTGASSGIFTFKADSNQEAEKQCRFVKNLLAEDEALKHATFVVDVLPASSDEDDFAMAREKLLAMNRWQQMQAPSIAVPVSQRDAEPCDLDMVRPTIKTKTGPAGKPISESVYQRRNYGKDQKQKFYKEHTGTEDLPEFVNDFSELSYDPETGNLHHKMAVIYIDGNSFGALQARLCKTIKKQEDFDTKIKGYRKIFLQQMLASTVNKKEWQNNGKHRLETLLWGGDEIIWVVPAWLGWWTLANFYSLSRNWRFETEPLTHGAGLVFCHHNAPIQRITVLAHDLASLAKDKGRKKNYVAYQVLESFDNVGRDLAAFRRQRCPKVVYPGELILDGAKMNPAIACMPAIRKGMPRTKLQTIVDKLFHAPDNVELVVENVKKDLNKETNEQLTALEDCFGSGPAFWMHLADLWDYIEGGKDNANGQA